MDINKSTLLKEWIQFLKNNQIVEIKSDPQTGKLTYRRKVTSDDLFKFLEVNTDFDKSTISKAIRAAVKLKTPARPEEPPKDDKSQVATVPPRNNKPQSPALPAPVNNAKPKKKYNNDDATDIDYREVNEAITDGNSRPLDETDVENIFDILISQANAPAGNNPTTGNNSQAGNNARSGNNTQPAPASDPEKREEDIRKLKRVIRDTMTANQRMALWRAINE